MWPHSVITELEDSHTNSHESPSIKCFYLISHTDCLAECNEDGVSSSDERLHFCLFVDILTRTLQGLEEGTGELCIVRPSWSAYVACQNTSGRFSGEKYDMYRIVDVFIFAWRMGPLNPRCFCVITVVPRLRSVQLATPMWQAEPNRLRIFSLPCWKQVSRTTQCCVVPLYCAEAHSSTFGWPSVLYAHFTFRVRILLSAMSQACKVHAFCPIFSNPCHQS
jgi:hypothetical protein